MDRTQFALIRQNAQQMVITALVMTHPDPARFADLLQQLFAHGQVEWAQNGVSPDVRQVGREFVEELIDIARQEAAHLRAP